MLRKLAAPFLYLALLCNGSLAAKDHDILAEERIGSLSIGLSETDLKQLLDCPLKRGKDLLWGADGAYHQTWKYADCGLEIGMVAEKRGATKRIESLTVTAPCTFPTKRGIRIGSTEKEVRKAYSQDWNREDSTHGSFVAGSIYGGIIFQFLDGKVDRIFLGAAAE